MSGKPRKYTPEFREQAARQVIETGRPVVHVAAEIGVGEQVLGRWVRLAREAAGGGDTAWVLILMTARSWRGCAERTPNCSWTGLSLAPRLPVVDAVDTPFEVEQLDQIEHCDVSPRHQRPSIHRQMDAERTFLRGPHRADIPPRVGRVASLFVIPEGAGFCQVFGGLAFCRLAASGWAASDEDRGQDGAPAA
jgi:hypothetical protein